MKKNPVILLISLFVFAFCSCKITGVDSLPSTSFRVINVSPNAPGLDVYANSSPVASNLAYDSSTDYIVSPSGNYELKVAAAGTSTYIIDATIGFQAGKLYSIFTIDSLSKIKAVATPDIFTIPPTDSIRLRFLHFSTNTGIIDFAEAGDTILFASRSFNDQFLNASAANYITLPAATYNFEIRPAGAPAVLLSLPGVALPGGKAYTIYVKGFSGGAGTQALGISVLTDNP